MTQIWCVQSNNDFLVSYAIDDQINTAHSGGTA
jgi:hypothetical protein